MIDFDKLEKTPLVSEPFPYLVQEGVLDGARLRAINSDFPAITHPGVFPLSELTYGRAFADLIADIEGDRLEALIEEKFNVDLSDKPLMITVRGYCQRKDGRIHTDSKDKFITCLLYLNEGDWSESGGRLRLLRNGRNLDDMIAEAPPTGGTLLAFRRTDHSWHGHAPFEGQRRYIMFNWMESDAALARNIGRHKISAVFKRLGFSGGY